MKTIKTQKGFIPIILVIVIAVAIVSATAGIVKYKDEITANVSNVFKSKIENPNEEDREAEELELTEEPLVEVENKEKQDDTQQLQEQLRIAEQKRLEAEKQLAEEKAKQEAEKVKAEAEELEQKAEEAKRQAEESLRKAQEDTALKIAQCQAKRDADYSDFVNKLDQMIADTMQELKNDTDTFINEQKIIYKNCLAEVKYNSMMTPSDNLAIMKQESDFCYSSYLNSIQAKKSYTDQLIAKTNAARDTTLSKAKSVVDSEYYQCVNR